jgi:hypothetical protein
MQPKTGLPTEPRLFEICPAEHWMREWISGPQMIEQNARVNFFQDPWAWAALAVGGFVLSLTLWFGLAMDQSTYAYSAWAWKAFHLSPYLGTWDHNFPGIFIVHRVAIELFGPSSFGFRLFDFLVQLSSLAMIFLLAKKISGSSLAGFAAALTYSVYYYGLGQMGAGEREGFVFWIFLLAMTMSMSFEKAALPRMGLTGFLLGSAFLLKPFFGLAWLVFLAWFLLERNSSKGKKYAGLLFLSFGCVAPSVLVILYYWRIDHLTKLYQAMVWYNLKVYSRMAPPLSQTAGLVLRNIFRDLFIDQLPVLVSALAGFAFMARRNFAANEKSPRPLIYALIAVSLISYLLQGRYFSYHLVPFWGLLTILSGVGLAGIARRLAGLSQAAWPKVAATVFFLAFFALTFANLSRPMREFPFKYAYRSFDRSYLAELGRYDGHLAANYYLAAMTLKDQVQPDDQVEFFGPYPLINFLLKKKLPSRFPCVQNLLYLPRGGARSALQEQWIKEYSNAVISARPRFFLVSDYFPGQKNPFFNFSERSLEKALDRDFPELRRFLSDNYRLVETVGKVQVFALKEK